MKRVDDEVKEIIDTAYNTAYKILEDNRDALDRLSNHLLAKETISGKEFMELLDTA